MPREIVDGNDTVVPQAAAMASKFLTAIARRTLDEGLDIDLHGARRGIRDLTPILRATVKAGYQNDVQLEVFADPQGRGLHVGWHASRLEIGGFLSQQGSFGRANAMNRAIGGTANKQRKLAGILQSFELLVFRPVVDQLVEAMRVQQSGSSGNGFLGA